MVDSPARPVDGASAWGGGPAIIGQSRVITELLADLRRFSLTDAKVLITGESGVGKELVAAYLHAHSRRVARQFVAINCAGMPETLLESELFGHVKGSFTGAYRDKRGKFELAHMGTLFLDEVGEMSLRMQRLLLRVLDSGELQKIGADQPTGRADVRLIAATNRDLAALVQTGQFREDLYYRLNVIHVRVPALRERREDVPLLATFFLERLARQTGVQCRFAPDFFEALRDYVWPGNVRQLDNLVQRLAVNSRAGVITAADLPPDLQVATVAAIPPRRHDRRRSVADILYERIRGGASFWEVVREPYMMREITREDVRAVVKKGLEETRGNYRLVTRLLNIDVADYKKFLSFLRKHHCLLPYRDFR
jgi:transcriptional regulator with PAS, ATPase and Fis domain